MESRYYSFRDSYGGWYLGQRIEFFGEILQAERRLDALRMGYLTTNDYILVAKGELARMISDIAAKIIMDALNPIIERGRKIERISLVVSSESKLATIPALPTDHGDLKVKVSTYVPKGVSYLLEDPGQGVQAFDWIHIGSYAQKPVDTVYKQ